MHVYVCVYVWCHHVCQYVHLLYGCCCLYCCCCCCCCCHCHYVCSSSTYFLMMVCPLYTYIHAHIHQHHHDAHVCVRVCVRESSRSRVSIYACTICAYVRITHVRICFCRYIYMHAHVCVCCMYPCHSHCLHYPLAVACDGWADTDVR